MGTQRSSGCTASCGASTDSELHLCRAHTDLLSDILSGVPDLVADLEVTVTRQNRTVSERHGARSSTTPLPWNEHAAHAGAELAATLNRISITVAGSDADERDRLTAVAAYDTANLARWLRRNLALIRRAPEAGTMLAEIDDAVRLARRAVDRPPERSPLGRCGAEIDEAGTECREYLYARPGASRVFCRCGSAHDVAARRDWMLRHCRGLRGTAPQLASWLLMFGITTTAGAVRAKAARKRFAAVARSGDSPTYRLVDVIDAYSGTVSRVPS